MSSGPFTAVLVVPRCVLSQTALGRELLQQICKVQGLGQAGEVWSPSVIPMEHDLEVMFGFRARKIYGAWDEKTLSMDDRYVEQML